MEMEAVPKKKTNSGPSKRSVTWIWDRNRNFDAGQLHSFCPSQHCLCHCARVPLAKPNSRKGTITQGMQVLWVQLWAEFSADLASPGRSLLWTKNRRDWRMLRYTEKMLVCTVLDSGLSNECLDLFSIPSLLLCFQYFFPSKQVPAWSFNAPYWEQPVSQCRFCRLEIVRIAVRMLFSSEGEAVKQQLFCRRRGENSNSAVIFFFL